MNLHEQNKAKIKPNTKIRILSPEHSEYVQKLAFEVGAKWPGGEDILIGLGFRFIFIDAKLRMKYALDDEYFILSKYFNLSKYEEIKIDIAPTPNEINARVLAEKMNPLQTQVDGSHYKDLAIQPVEYIHANGIGFLEGSVIKYVSRWKNKNGIKDLEKAKHFIELLIELEGR